MKPVNFAKAAKIAKINPKNVSDVREYLAEVMGYFNISDSKWDTLSDEYILHLCEQYEEEFF
jgi:hypothetical protein